MTEPPPLTPKAISTIDQSHARYNQSIDQWLEAMREQGHEQTSPAILASRLSVGIAAKFPAARIADLAAVALCRLLHAEKDQPDDA